MCCSTHCSRDKYLARPVINKKGYKEIIFCPCLVLREARTKLDKIKLMILNTYLLTYSVVQSPS